VEPNALGSGFRELLAEILVLGTTLVLALAGLLRRRAGHAEPQHRRRPVGFGALLFRVVVVAAACYAVLVGFIGLFVLVAGGDPSHLLRGAAGGGALLAFGVVVPGFLILSMLAAGITRLRRGTPDLALRLLAPGGAGTVQGLILHFPRALLPLPPPRSRTSPS
jgi:hypothetical protein